jgi:UrcA family protein
MFTRIVLPALALACAATAPALAAAEPAKVYVPFGDLDLTKDAGRKTLDIRLARATRKVCGGAAPMRNLAMAKAYRECLAEVKTGYQSQVELALNNANARRVAVLADKIALLARF